MYLVTVIIKRGGFGIVNGCFLCGEDEEIILIWLPSCSLLIITVSLLTKKKDFWNLNEFIYIEKFLVALWHYDSLYSMLHVSERENLKSLSYHFRLLRIC